MIHSNERQLPQKTLVVGGAGYIGSVLVQRLLSSGRGVCAFDNLTWGSGNSLLGVADNPDFEFFRGDMRNREEVREALQGVDAVVLLAGLVGDPITKMYPEQAMQVNVDGVRATIQESLEAGVGRLVFISTCSNYGLREDDSLATESSPLNPLSLYAEQKVEIEEMLMQVGRASSSAITVLRFATAFGVSPRMRTDLTVSHFAKDAVLDGRIEIYDPDTWRPYCHIDDLCTAIQIVLSSDRVLISGEVFNIGSTAENYTKRTLGELILKLRPGVELVFRDGGGDARNYRVSFDKASRQLGFSTQISIVDHLPLLLSAFENGIIATDAESLARMGNFRL